MHMFYSIWVDSGDHMKFGDWLDFASLVDETALFPAAGGNLYAEGYDETHCKFGTPYVWNMAH